MPQTYAAAIPTGGKALSARATFPVAWLHLGLCGGAAVGLAVLWWAGGGFVFPLDDAYITLHNARVLLQGHDPNYGVSALTGATSLVHLALVAALSTILPSELALYLLSGASILLFVSGVLAMALQQGLTRTEATILAVAALVTGAMHLLNGLETGLALAAVTWTIVLAARPHPTRWLALACGTLPFLRPELGLLSLVLMTRQAWLRARSDDAPAAWMTKLALDALLALAAAAPWLFLSWVETGALVPNTLAAKQAFYAVPPTAWAVGLVSVLTVIVAALGPSFAALVLAPREGLFVALCAFLGSVALGFAATLPEAAALSGGRYLYPLIPVGLYALCRLAARPDRRLMRVVLAAQCLVGAVAIANVVSNVTGAQGFVRDYTAVAAWAGANLPRESRVLIHDAGTIAYRTQLALTDLVGLKSPGSVADHRSWTVSSHTVERFRAVDAIARRAAATHAIILDDHPERFWSGLADDLRKAGWGLDLIFSTGRESGYRVYRLTPPAGHGLALRDTLP